MSRIVVCVSALFALALPVQAQPKDDPLPSGVLARLGEVRYPNVGRVFSLAFSPDGKTLLAGAWDGSIRLWDVATGKQVRQYAGHRGWVRSVAFAPDGQTFASGGKDKILRIWETATGKELRHLEGHQNWIQYVAFTPDGKTLASRGTGSTIRLWDVLSGRESRRIELQPHTPSGQSSFAFSPDGQLLAYPCDVRSIAFLELATGKESRRITGQPYWYGNLAFLSNSTILVGVAQFQSQPLHFWDATTGKELRPFVKLEGNVCALAVSPDRHSLAEADGEHTVRIWELATRQERFRFQSPDTNPFVLAYSPDGRILAQASDDISVLLWDATGLQGKNRPRTTSLSAKELQTVWEDLAKADAGTGRHAIRFLVAGSKESVPFIQEHLRPIASFDASTLARLVAELDSDRFETREQATEKLEILSELAEPALRRALRDKPPLERRQRIERLLEKVARQRDDPSPRRLRMLRALEALEQMDTPAARQILDEYARGPAAADLTNEAKAALDRLGKRSLRAEPRP